MTRTCPSVRYVPSTVAGGGEGRGVLPGLGDAEVRIELVRRLLLDVHVHHAPAPVQSAPLLAPPPPSRPGGPVEHASDPARRSSSPVRYGKEERDRDQDAPVEAGDLGAGGGGGGAAPEPDDPPPPSSISTIPSRPRYATASRTRVVTSARTARASCPGAGGTGDGRSGRRAASSGWVCGCKCRCCCAAAAAFRPGPQRDLGTERAAAAAAGEAEGEEGSRPSQPPPRRTCASSGAAPAAA